MRRTSTLLLATGLLLSLSTATFAGLSPLERLGKAIFFDEIASPDRQACASCHAPDVGFTGPNANYYRADVQALGPGSYDLSVVYIYATPPLRSEVVHRETVLVP